MSSYEENGQEEDHDTNVLFGRKWNEMKESFAYAVWMLNADDEDGPGSRVEYEFIVSERVRIKF